MRYRIFTLWVIGTFACTLFNLNAEVVVNRMFSDHMVLQRDMPVPIWGTAVAGEKITVQYRDQTKSTTAAADGKWMLKLDSLSR